MRSLRLDDEFEARIEQAAAMRGESVSEFLRRAAADRVELTFRADPIVEWSDVLGVVHGGGGRARRTGAAFRDVLAESTQR
jgi:hypothetical protein